MSRLSHGVAMNLRDTASLVTGASRGLGRALAETLAAAGSRVVMVAREREPLERAAAEIRSAGGIAHALVADVGDISAVHPIAAQAAALVGPIDILVNNASTLGPTPLRVLLDTECEDLTRVLEVNLVGPFRLTKVVAGSMALRGRGLVVNISSDASVEAYPTWGAYSISKAALDHLTRIWAVELAEAGVRFLAIDPGEMNTRMHADAMPEADPTSLADPAEIAARITAVLAASEPSSGARLKAEAP